MNRFENQRPNDERDFRSDFQGSRRQRYSSDESGYERSEIPDHNRDQPRDQWRSAAQMNDERSRNEQPGARADGSQGRWGDRNSESRLSAGQRFEDQYSGSEYLDDDRPIRSGSNRESWNERGGAQRSSRSKLNSDDRYGSEHMQHSRSGSYPESNSPFGRTSGGYYGSDFDAHRSQSENRGMFYGRGPRGYRRSDERLKEDICEQLMRDDEIDAENIEVEVENGVVTLRGECDSKDTKRRCEDLVEEVLGVTDVNNEVKVQRGILASIFSPDDSEGRSGQSNSQPRGATTKERRSDSMAKDRENSSELKTQRPTS